MTAYGLTNGPFLHPNEQSFTFFRRNTPGSCPDRAYMYIPPPVPPPLAGDHHPPSLSDHTAPYVRQAGIIQTAWPLAIPSSCWKFNNSNVKEEDFLPSFTIHCGPAWRPARVRRTVRPPGGRRLQSRLAGPSASVSQSWWLTAAVSWHHSCWPAFRRPCWLTSAGGGGPEVPPASTSCLPPCRLGCEGRTCQGPGDSGHNISDGG